MRCRLLSVTGLAVGLAVVAAVPAVAAPTSLHTHQQTRTQDLKLIGDPHVTETNSLTLKAKKIRSGTLVLACFTFTFTGDLVDPGEGLVMFPDEPESGGLGFVNVFTSPIATRTVCADDPVFLSGIADGNRTERFVLSTDGQTRDPDTSTFTVSSVTMTLTYA